MLQSMRLPGVGHNLLTEHNNNKFGNSLVVLWLGFYPFTLGGTGLILGWGTEILQAAWSSKKSKAKQNKQKPK